MRPRSWRWRPRKGLPPLLIRWSTDILPHSVFCAPRFLQTRPKPAYGRQGLDSDRWARIQFSQVHFGKLLKPTKNHETTLKTLRHQQRVPTDFLWCKYVTVTNTGPKPTSFGAKSLPSLTRGPNRPPLMQKRYRH